MGRRELPRQHRRQPRGADRIPAARHGRRQTSLDVRAGELHARTAARPVGRADLERRGGRHASAGRCIGARPGPRSLRSLDDDLARAWQATGGQQDRETAISYAAYRLLVWRASYGANLERTFALLSGRLRALCLSPDFTRASGGSAAALGNRIGAAAIAAGRHDGSNEALHYADPSYTPVNEPLLVGASGSTGHDPTFWQPLARSQKAAQGGGSVPADVQTFEDSQWGHVRTFAAGVDAGPPRLGDPSSAAYKQAAVAAIRATSQAGAGRGGRVADRLEPRRCTAPRGDRRSCAPRARRSARSRTERRAQRRGRLRLGREARVPVAAADLDDPVPRVQQPAAARPGPVKRVGGRQLVLRAGRWVPGARWSPLAPTPASPGWASGDSAFAYAAGEVLTAFTGRSFAGPVARAAMQGVDRGTELPGDVTAGRTVGAKVGKLVWHKLAG